MDRDRIANATLLTLCVVAALYFDGWARTAAVVAAVLAAAAGVAHEARVRRS